MGSILSDSFYGVRLHIFEKDKDKATELMNLIHSAREDEDESLWSEMDLDEVSD